jgi:hypothetical protein
MSLLDRLFGRLRAASAPRASHTRLPPRQAGQTLGGESDAQALERYRYLMRTAPPEVLEQVHREAFSRLTPEQRRRALHELNASVPPSERIHRDDPAALARMATRAELMRPGTVVSAFGGSGFGGVGLGGLLAGGLLTSFVGSAMGSMLAHQWMDGWHGGHGFDPGYGDGYGDGYGEGFEAGQDASGQDASGQDASGQDAAGLEDAGGWDDGGGFDGGHWGDGGGFDDTVT